MNKKLLLLLTLALFFVIPSSAQSPDRKFGFEINGGIREYHGDLGSALYFARRPDYQAVGGGLSMYINPSFDATIYGATGDLGFHKTTYDIKTTSNYHQGFRANISEILLGVTYKFNNGYIIQEDAMFKPFLKAGWGGMQSVSTLYHNRVGYANNRTWFASHWNAGAGVKIRLTPGIDFILQEQFNYSFDDNYDGEPFTLAAAILNDALPENKPLHDIYLYHSAGLVFNFGGGGGSSTKVKDSDKDGVADDFDLCPKTPEGYEVDTVGCPLDDDKDGIVNEEDECPKVYGVAEFKGCPDTDGDGIPDSEDKCPKKAGSKEGEGCPDSDGDGLYDHLDKCPFSKGPKDNDGCPKNDRDGDGIADEADKCPDVPGIASFDGCPDSDKDGIQDSEDKCPLIQGTEEGEGCPDTDKDGVYDHKDVCPVTPGPASNKGCPEIKEEVKQEIALAAKGIYFESGKDIIKNESYANLDQLVTILNRYKEAKVSIEGHTDSQGADAANQDLSQRRANAVKRYLESHGLDGSRLTAIGYGETQPVADNSTASGRALNRRVDFKLSY